MNQSTEQKRWSLILADPQSPAELQADARAHLGIKADPSPQHRYAETLDSVVENYWRKPKAELEGRDVVAESAYALLVSWLILGGVSDYADADAAKLLEILAACRSHWMRYRVARSLLTIRILHKSSITSQTCHAIESALDALNFDFTKAEERDWLELLRTAKEYETASM